MPAALCFNTGLANNLGSTEDVFIHSEVQSMAGMASLEISEVILVRTVEGDRMRMAVEVAGCFQDQALDVGNIFRCFLELYM